MMKEKILGYVQGALELALFMRSGIGFFPADRRAALWSFIAPVLTTAIALTYLLVKRPESFAGMSAGAICILTVLQATLAVMIFFSCLRVFSIWAEQQEKFWHFVTAVNWTGLVVVAAMLPFMILDAGGWAPEHIMHAMMALIGLYGYVITGCIATRVFEIPWMLGVTIGIFEMLVSETLGHFMRTYSGAYLN